MNTSTGIDTSIEAIQELRGTMNHSVLFTFISTDDSLVVKEIVLTADLEEIAESGAWGGWGCCP